MREKPKLNTNHRAEILSPAGSFDALKAAVMSGADAVYFGLKDFNARYRADNCGDEENLKTYIDYCHLNNVKAYAAVNILIKDSEMMRCLDAVIDAYNLGADAFIIQDVGLISLLDRVCPEIAVHLSTQAGVFDARGLEILRKNSNVKRVVLARECELSQVKDVLSSGVEVEIFVHGALCVGFSGSCYLSSMLTGDSGNRGRCHQLCRMKYDVLKNGNDNIKISGGAVGKIESSYILSPRDIATVDNIGMLNVLGVDSFKIEGRMKSSEYVGNVTRIYRRALSNKPVQGYESLLKRVYSRGGFSKGYIFTRKTADIMYKHVQSSIGEDIGKVVGVCGKSVKITSVHALKAGDGCKIIRDKCEVGGGSVAKVLDAKRGEYLLNASGNPAANDRVHLTLDTSIKAVNEDLRSKFLVSFSFFARENERVKLTASFGGKQYDRASSGFAEAAKNISANYDSVKKQLLKVGDKNFNISIENIDIEGELFLEIGMINELRRNIVSDIENDILLASRRDVSIAAEALNFKNLELKDKKSVVIVGFIDSGFIAKNRDSYHIVYNPDELKEDIISQNADSISEMFLYLPYYLTAANLEFVKGVISKFKGVYANNDYAAALAKEYGLELIIGDMNVFNRQTLAFYSGFTDKITLSKELSYSECAAAAGDCRVIIPAYGDIELMQLSHCPVQNAYECSCANCRLGGGIKFRDKYNETFEVRRHRLKECYFMLINSKSQNGLNVLDRDRYNVLFNLAALSVHDAERALSGEFISTGEVTNGHLKRGVK